MTTTVSTSLPAFVAEMLAMADELPPVAIDLDTVPPELQSRFSREGLLQTAAQSLVLLRNPHLAAPETVDAR